MARLRRIRFCVATLLWIVKGMMLIVSLAIVVLWVRSYWRADWLNHVTYVTGSEASAIDNRQVISGCGSICMETIHLAYPGRTAVDLQGRWNSRPDWMPGWHHRTDQAHTEPRKGAVTERGWGPVRWDVRQWGPGPQMHHYRLLRIPHRFAASVVGAWPLVSVALVTCRSARRRRASRHGLCRHCGYDLRATPDGAGGLLSRCPECGAASEAEKTTARL